MEHLIIILEAPLMAFGGERIDNRSVVRPFPSSSMITGLLANAMGWRSIETQRHQDLQDRLVFAARIDREPHGESWIQDFQSVQINRQERAWTTRGRPEGRDGGTYRNDLRYRDYYPDMRVTAALRLEPAGTDPELAEVADALRKPLRTLFIGRKTCLPATPLFGGTSEGRTALDALVRWQPDGGMPVNGPVNRNLRAMWPRGEGSELAALSRTFMVTDQRNWNTGPHGGGRTVCQGRIPSESSGGPGPEGK